MLFRNLLVNDSPDFYQYALAKIQSAFYSNFVRPMQVRVRQLRKLGALIVRKELLASPQHLGLLRVGEERDPALGRPVMRARLLELNSGLETDVLPQLNDARLLCLEGAVMRFVGTERRDNAEFGQTWEVEKLPC